MKQFLLRAACICMLLLSANYPLSAKSVTVPLDPIPADGDEEKNPFGHRIPPAPISLLIDFDSETVVLSRPVDSIGSYRVMSADGTIVYYSGESVTEFVRSLADLYTPVVIVVTSASGSFSGYVEL